MVSQHTDNPRGSPQGGIGVNLGSILFGNIFDPGKPLPHGECRLDAFLNCHPADPLHLRPQGSLRAGAAVGKVLLWTGRLQFFKLLLKPGSASQESIMETRQATPAKSATPSPLSGHGLISWEAYCAWK